ncbi:unnamed protein product, partial [Nesidiocoris tenuis]
MIQRRNSRHFVLSELEAAKNVQSMPQSNIEVVVDAPETPSTPEGSTPMIFELSTDDTSPMSFGMSSEATFEISSSPPATQGHLLQTEQPPTPKERERWLSPNSLKGRI